jgi:hypothetical protein
VWEQIAHSAEIGLRLGGTGVLLAPPPAGVMGRQIIREMWEKRHVRIVQNQKNC